MSNNKKAAFGLIGIIAVVAIALVAALVLPSFFGGSNKASADAKDKNYAEIAALLGVKTVTQHCATSTDSKVVATNIGALKPVPPRKWSDALSTPLQGSNPQERRANLDKSICSDPLLGVSYANMFANLTVDGVKLTKVNSWLQPFADVSDVNDLASEFAPLQDVDHATDAQTKQALDMNHKYQELANRLNTLVSRFKVVGVQSLRSVQNWHLMGGGLAVGGLPEVGLDSRQDTRPALVFEVTLKNSTCPILRIGTNVGDKRPEVFDHGCQPRKVIKSTPQHHKVLSRHHQPPAGGCRSSCSPSHRCVRPPKPSGGAYMPTRCSWKKVPQTFNQMQNHGPAHQPVQDNHTSGVNTGKTPGAGSGTSSPSNGGTGTAPSGGGSDGSGGTAPDNPPVDTGQGGSNNTGGTTVNPITNPG